MRQKLKIALQMDPLEKLDLRGDSTFILGLEAIKRGFELYFYSPSDLIYKNNNVYAKAKILDLAFKNGKETFNYGKVKILKLSSLLELNFFILSLINSFKDLFILLKSKSKEILVSF